jgi:hypothetical protein
MLYHLIVGDMAAEVLRKAIELEPSLEGEVVVLRDILHVGPLQTTEGQSFSDLRTEFWKGVSPDWKEEERVDDFDRLSAALIGLKNNLDAKVWFWMAPTPADVTAYHWLLKYMQPYQGRFLVVNINGLPFLDENGKVFYPKGFGEVIPKEVVKARKLNRVVSLAEFEVDQDEWIRLVDENGGIRIHEGGKKLKSQPIEFYDGKLFGHLGQQFQKASKVVNTAMSKSAIPTGDLFLGWRLKQMAQAGTILLQGDTEKTLRDFDVKLPGQVEAEAEAIAEA